MNPSYTALQMEKAVRDVMNVYELAEERMKASCIPFDAIQLRNAFQVFRYAFREWGMTKDPGVVLRALFFSENRVREVKQNPAEVVFQVEDKEIAESLENLLRGYGYEEESLHDSQE